MTRRVLILNPVGATLAHYVRETEAVLQAGGARVQVRSILEPSASGRSRLSWILQAYGQILRAAVQRPDMVVAVWPVLGYVDAVLMNFVLGRRGVLIMHDPVPLVRAIGYGRMTTAVARRLNRLKLVVHSHQAREVMVSRDFGEPWLVPHPILTLEPRHKDRSERGPIRVVVTGQYKRDRDLALLAQIAQQANGEAVLSVHGRGWPSVPGWTVDDRFLPEEELDEVMLHADVVLIPYKRFYQSGVAIRAFELGTAVVGPRASSLADMYVECVENLPRSSDPREWWTCIKTAARTSARDIDRDRVRYVKRVEDSWADLLSSGAR